MDLTVIVPTHNRSELLEMTLEGFCQQTTGELAWELIVVNDGSIDRTSEIVAEFQGRLPLRYLYQANSGVSRARNLGLSEARAPIIIFIDDDVIPNPHLLTEHMRFHEEHPDFKEVLLGYTTWYPELACTPFMRWYGEFGGLFGFSLLKDNQIADPRYLYTCNISFKTNFLRENHGFNETLSVLEDYELSYRLTVQGMRMYFRKSALGYHNQTFSFNQACARLERYSSALPAFCSTEAGQTILKRRAGFLFRSANTIVRILGPLLSPFRGLVDSRTKLPNAIYRLFYWYYGSHLAFWSRYTRNRT